MQFLQLPCMYETIAANIYELFAKATQTSASWPTSNRHTLRNVYTQCRHFLVWWHVANTQNRSGRVPESRPIIQRRVWKICILPAIQDSQEGVRNRTEPDRATTRSKSAGRTASNREIYFLNRTKPINFRKLWNRNESNRTGSFLTEAPCVLIARIVSVFVGLPACILTAKRQRHFFRRAIKQSMDNEATRTNRGP